ncbi:putative 2-oxoglutarate-dependent dioxygenase Tropcp [[Candida] jaroonii]|uniref:2-oxoglutarate-dependent dioxygenase Tropcp n=1 Tax=[Candida] jaroonii TaxID=467808 RepID=A0ACA9YEI3_9ASCO|nr:putative 2-oxoglutarate-dependent dioxygenase Tropcp [[Candida] jaroonii]
MSGNPLKIVDVSNIDQATGDEIFKAANTQGFLFIEGHNFEAEEVEELFKLSKEFFELPLDYKMKHLIDQTNHGYTNYNGENLDPSIQKKGDPKEAFNFAQLNLINGDTVKDYPTWFTEDPKKEKIIRNAITKLNELNLRILKLLAIGLKIEDDEVQGENWFDDKYKPDKPSGTTFRLLHYPGQKKVDPESVIRAGAHTDYGSITLLFQQEGQEGLEIYSPVSKSWEAVPFVENNEAKFPGKSPPIIVNIADQLSYWTAGLLKSTIHRVKFPAKVQATGQDRYSIVYFSHPNDDTKLLPVPSPLTKDIKGRGANNAKEIITARQHLDKRLASTYNFY